MIQYSYIIFGPDALTIVGGSNCTASACEQAEHAGGYILDMAEQVWRNEQFEITKAPTSQIIVKRKAA